MRPHDPKQLETYARLRALAAEVYQDATDVGSPRPRPMLDAAVVGQHVTPDSDDAMLILVHRLACDALRQELATTGVGFESTQELINAVGDILASDRMLKVGADGGWVPDVRAREIYATADLATMRQLLAERIGAEAAALPVLEETLALLARNAAQFGWADGVGPAQGAGYAERIYRSLGAMIGWPPV